ncbi:ABC transporter permease [Limobrevibacterium gyesilva]|uniref:ABC transporter permease n=1 Tax=Limobrevibacterium gyesilva TaxID=2991712 RepID=A0AA41YLW5_9PROT|nr:ABC transporter permease [Limobrevibacterium gyesilva]MCW3474358.1 ABC transporter permease [Limobrevibacterium gyesilva]
MILLATLGRRLLVAVPILLVVSVLLFVALRVLPVDPAAMSMPPNATRDEIEGARRQMGLDRPLPEQYAIWLGHAVHGDFGRSIHLRRDVLPLIGQTLPGTIELAVCAMVVASVLGLAGGLLLFSLRGRAAEAVAETGTTLLMSIPEFLWALLFIFVFGVLLQAMPFTGRLDPGLERPVVTGFLLLDALLVGRVDVFRSAAVHLLLPAVALGLAFAPPIMRVLRSSLLDVYHEDYIRQARLRGVSETRILLRHALKNAILPTLTLMGVQFGFLFGGSLLVEVIYSYPGMGNLMVDAVRNADLPIIQLVGLTYCVVVLLINSLVDGLYLVLNPRLRKR